MIENTFVIDAVAHSYNFAPDNYRVGDGSSMLAEFVYGAHVGFSPRNQPQWVLDKKRFMEGKDPELLAHAFFAESQTDVCIYHAIPSYGAFYDGGVPLWVGKKMREMYPGRVLLYGAVSPWQENVFDEIDRLIDEEGVVGIKLYPADVVEGRLKTYTMDDPEAAFPIFEHIQKRGLRVVAIHKAVPFGPWPKKAIDVTDMEVAAQAFPGLHFEIVHGGVAFVEETVLQLMRFPNLSVNLEGTSAFIVNAPRRFAEVLGKFLGVGAADRIVWASGCVAFHPQPYLEAFWNFEMPQDLVEGYGYPQITKKMKAAILGGNIARILGLEIKSMEQTFAGDRFAAKAELAAPWSGSQVVAQ